MGRNVNREEVFRLEKEEALKDNLGNLKGDFLTEYIHPEVDTKANLQLKTLFSCIISISNYLKSRELSASNLPIKIYWNWKAWNWKNWKIPIASNLPMHIIAIIVYI
ncbi:hypothetical protein RclHR1_08380003 [Rhizophagus clarus]|uniref:Uncharacterized protein n=1 Tax=Rhizophagus clarus TaxID=94130 RepID=A0A2Z6SFS4_9GLOM|nr:hypothetical protein RclHR1_08380003 [Rhizophagus clarus]